jgi:pimeloyl-ACP methyl ester carboxylesterase
MRSEPDAERAARARTGSHRGLAYVRLDPDSPSRGGVVILHGAGSRKENHLDFARRCADAGLTVVVFDQRGHGESEGALGAGALDDVAAIAELLPHGPRFLRGSSMGGFVALAAARQVGARGVVAICPASAAGLLTGLRSGRFGFRADHPGLERLIASVDLAAAARALGPDLLLLHAKGDDVVPVQQSETLHDIAAGSSFIRVPGGDHGSVQHDAALQADAVRFLLARASAAAAEGVAEQVAGALEDVGKRVADG